MNITLRQLQQLLVLSEENNYRRAAARLFMAQPALTVSIQKMESQLDVILVERDSRGTRLTAAGLAMLQDARSALIHAERACYLAKSVGAGEMGTVRLGFVNSAIHELLPTTLSVFRTRYPKIKFELTEDSTWDIIRKIEDYELDVGIVRGPVARSPNLTILVIEEDDLLLVVPEGHNFARRKSISLSECKAEEFVLFGASHTPGLHSVALGLCHAAGFSPSISQAALQVQTLVGLVASGTGIALVPAITRSHTRARVSFIELTDPGAHRCLSLSLVVRNDLMSSIVERLYKVMISGGQT